jgi:hypothetical protein
MPRTNSNSLVYCLTGQVEFYSHPGTLNPDRGLIGDSNEQDCTWLGISSEFYFITRKRPFIVMPKTNSNTLVYCLTLQVEF